MIKQLAAILLLVVAPAFAQERTNSVSSEIRLGVVAPLTGNWSSYGQAIRNGVELAQEDLSGQSRIKIFYEDACLPADAVKAVRTLIDFNHIQALVGSYCIIGMEAMAPSLKKSKVFAFQTSVLPDSLLNYSGTVFSTAGRIRDEAEAIAEYAFTHDGHRRAAILSLATQWGENFAEHFAKRFISLGGALVAQERVNIGVTDFRSELTKLEAKNPDLLFVSHVGPELGVVLKQMRELGSKADFYSIDEADEERAILAAGRSMEGLKFITSEPAEDNDAGKAFLSRFANRFHYKAPNLARQAYDAVVISTKALEECKLDVACASNLILGNSEYRGVSGNFSITSSGASNKVLTVKVMRDGKFVVAN